MRVSIFIVLQKEQSGLLFEWVDGVVVMAMKEGGCLLVDEISLADDAVLERLNSILEPERKLVISERSRCSDKEVFQISANEGFQFLATMNPGGDYGKKEVCQFRLCCSGSFLKHNFMFGCSSLLLCGTGLSRSGVRPLLAGRVTGRLYAITSLKSLTKQVYRAV